jgi:hypothetical protein
MAGEDVEGVRLSKPITTEEAQRYRERSRLVAQREREELRTMSIEDKFRQRAALFASAKAMGWADEGRDADVAFTRERWRLLREALGKRRTK